MANATVESKMIEQAQFGLFSIYERITHKKANQLIKAGLIVVDSKENKPFPRIHKIYWGQAVVECADVKKLNPYDKQYTFGQKLWIIAMQNQPKK